MLYKNDFQTIAEFTKENGVPVSFRECSISGEIRKGECGEIYGKEELRCRFEDDKESGECGEWETFEDYFDEATGMGGYFQEVIPAYYIVFLRHFDGVTLELEDENCAVARFDDIEWALEEAVSASERFADFDYISGEWKRPEITIECFRASR